jgi:hypothetical protein
MKHAANPIRLLAAAILIVAPLALAACGTKEEPTPETKVQLSAPATELTSSPTGPPPMPGEVTHATTQAQP